MTASELSEVARTCRELVAKAVQDGQNNQQKTIESMENRLRAMRGGDGAAAMPFAVKDALSAALAKRPASPGQGKELASIELKDILNVSHGFPEQYSAVAPLAQPSVGAVRALIPESSTNAGALDWLEETSFTNMADVVAEGAAKPKSDKVFTPKSLIIRTVAHYFKVSEQTYADLPQLVSIVENNGLYGVAYKVEQQILKGTGLAEQLTGIYPLAPAAPAAVAGDTLVDTLVKAIADLGSKGFSPNGIVVSWAEWLALQLLKDSTGRYLAGDLPRLPAIAVSPIMASGEWLVGDFARGSHLFSRQAVAIATANQNEDDFVRNMLTIRCEERLALAVWQPAAFLKNPAGAAGVEAAKAKRG